MKLTRATLAIVCSVVLFAACKKEDKDDDKTTPKTAKEYLVDGKWQLESMPVKETYNGVMTTYNQYDSLESCEKDDYIVFGSNGKVYQYAGAMKCDSKDDAVDSTATWNLLNDSKLVFVEDGKYFDTVNVTVSATNLSVMMTETDSLYSYESTSKYKNIK